MEGCKRSNLQIQGCKSCGWVHWHIKLVQNQKYSIGKFVIIAIVFQFLVHVYTQHLRQWTQTHMISELIGNIYIAISLSSAKEGIALPRGCDHILFGCSNIDLPGEHSHRRGLTWSPWGSLCLLTSLHQATWPVSLRSLDTQESTLMLLLTRIKGF